MDAIVLNYPLWLWLGFGALILTILSLDLGLFNRHAHTPSYKEAAVWSTVWVTLALSFAGFLFWDQGTLKGVEFLTGYIIEMSLSVDNLFVFLLIFSYFRVPSKYQHRVLFWGVLGALIMRVTIILLGTTLINRFHFILYLFGIFLLYTGAKMLRADDETASPEDNALVKLATRFVPLTRTYEEEKFFTSVAGRRTGTLLLLVLIIVEVTDLVFAVDSIPAVFGVTTDSFIVYTSNVFAILGLRSLFFLLAGVVEKFHYLKTGLALVLMLIGVKMLTENFLLNYISKYTLITASLAAVALILSGSVVVSILNPRTGHQASPAPPEPAVPIEHD